METTTNTTVMVEIVLDADDAFSLLQYGEVLAHPDGVPVDIGITTDEDTFDLYMEEDDATAVLLDVDDVIELIRVGIRMEIVSEGRAGTLEDPRVGTLEDPYVAIEIEK